MRFGSLSVIGCAVVLAAFACGDGESTTPGASTDSDAGADGATADAPDPCADGTPVPTASATLDAWPKYDAFTAPDLGDVAKVTSTDVPGPPAGVLVGKGGAWVFAALGPATGGQIGLLQRNGTTLTWHHGIATAANALPFGLGQSSSGALVAATVGTNVVLLDEAKAEANASDAIVASITNGSTKGATIDVKLTPDDKLAFAALENDGGVAVVDVDAQKLVGIVPIAGRGVTGIAVAPDGSRVYVSAEVANEFLGANPNPPQDDVIGSITVIDAAAARTMPAKSVLGHAFVGRAPVRLALSPDGSTLWTTLRGSNALIALATEHLLSKTCTPLLASVAVGVAPVGLTFVQNGAGIAVANSNRFAAATANQTVSFVSVKKALARSTDAVVGQVAVGAFPRELAADGDALFVTNFNSKTISGVDLSGISFE